MKFFFFGFCSRDSSVVWMIRGSSSGRGWKFFSSPSHPDRLWGPHSLLSNGYQGLTCGVKWPGHEADHSLPSNAEVKNTWSCTSTPPVYFHGMVLSLKKKHRENFTGYQYICVI